MSSSIKTKHRLPGIIRKIYVGPDYINCMVFSVGQKIMPRHQDDWEITEITCNPNNGTICIYVKNLESKEVFIYKSFNKYVPMSIEYSLEF